MQPIAIIGLSTLFPEASDPEQFWKNLLEGRDSRVEAGPEQMGTDPSLFYDPNKSTVDRYYCNRGGYIQDFSLDPEGFALDEETIIRLDNVYQWTLYVAREALRDSGYLKKPELQWQPTDRRGVGHLKRGGSNIRRWTSVFAAADVLCDSRRRLPRSRMRRTL